jgi:hypothetical protein
MITMKINGTISRHNSCYMFKKENCAQKQQIIIATKMCYLQATSIKYISYFHKDNIKLNNAINLNISMRLSA